MASEYAFEREKPLGKGASAKVLKVPQSTINESKPLTKRCKPKDLEAAIQPREAFRRQENGMFDLYF